MFTGVVSFYELWLLAYDTPKKDMRKVCAALIKLGITGIDGQMRRKQVYDALCGWKQAQEKLEQAQMLRDALDDLDLGTRWQQIYGMHTMRTLKHNTHGRHVTLHTQLVSSHLHWTIPLGCMKTYL